MTPDERNLLLLLARMWVPEQARACLPDFEKEVRAAIARIEETESKARDAFVAKIMKGST